MKKININELIWLLILGGFALYIGILLYTGGIINFINPRMVKYTFVGLIGIVILFLHQLGRLHNPGARGIKLGYLIFIFPLLLGFVLRPGSLNSSIGNSKGVNLTSSGNKSNSKPVDILDNKLIIIKDGTVVIDDKNFVTAMEEMEQNREKYKDKNIVITGFVFREKGFGKDEFILSRMLMACCAADSQIIGIITKGEEAKALKADDWVKVSGKIEYIEYKGEESTSGRMVPRIRVTSISKVPNPENPYVYP